MITDRQRTMLTHMSQARSLSVAAMIEALQTGRAQHVRENIAYNFNELCNKGFAQVDTDRRQGVGYCITPAGLAAIHSKAKPEPIRMNRIGVMKMPRYVPPSWGYVRTDSNKQYQSKGMA